MSESRSSIQLHSSSNSIGLLETTPLFLNKWIQWNTEMWGLRAERVCYMPKGKDLPRLDGILYLEKSGKIRMPPRNPYLPLKFTTTGTDRPEKIAHQYFEVMELFIKDIMQRGLRGTLTLPPGFIDARPFQWNGFQVDLKYTFIHNLPYDEKSADSSIRNKINKAKKTGYSVTRSDDWDAIYYCLKATEDFKGFTNKTNAAALSRCAELLTSKHFIGYLGTTPNGEPASGGLRLMVGAGLFLDWSQGSVREYLNSGINQLVYSYVLADAHSLGATQFDWGGANTPPVALAKSAWGSTLTPYLSIKNQDLRNAIKISYDTIRRIYNRC